MPYLNKDLKYALDEIPSPLDGGDLNYLITSLLIKYIENKGERYSSYNDCLGALEGAKLELYRRRVAPYEDKKKEENGDVY